MPATFVSSTEWIYISEVWTTEFRQSPNDPTQEQARWVSTYARFRVGDTLQNWTFRTTPTTNTYPVGEITSFTGTKELTPRNVLIPTVAGHMRIINYSMELIETGTDKMKETQVFTSNSVWFNI